MMAHKVGVAVPSVGRYACVGARSDTCTSSAAEVHAYIEPMRLHRGRDS